MLTLHDYLQVARERWKTILVGLLLGIATAATVTWTMVPQYSAQATIYISSHATGDLTDAYQGNRLSADKVKSYTQLLTSRRIGQDVVDRLGLNVPADEVAGQLSSSSEPETVLLSVQATDPSPARARDLANAAAGSFTGLVGQLERPAAGGPPTVTAQVVESARIPGGPVSPRPVLNIAVGVLLGLLGGYGAAMARHLLDTSIKSQQDLAKITDTPHLGNVAFDPEVPKRPLTVHTDPQSPRSEEFRKIRTNLQFVDVDSPNKAIVVTSAIPDEGKTTTLCNIAIAVAQAGSRVLVVETDLRRPRAAHYLGVEGAVGVTSVLSGRVSLSDAVQPWNFNMLDVLASGPIPPNPSELLASQQMSTLLKELRGRYDLIIFDAPPLLPVTDAAVLGAQCDGALIVARHGKTTTNQVKAAVSALEAASVRTLGTVLTMVPQPKSTSYYHYYYYSEERRPAAARPAQRGAATEVGQTTTNGHGEQPGQQQPIPVPEQGWRHERHHVR